MIDDPTTDGREFVDAQDRLAQAIERAQVGEDRQLAQEVREKGEQLATLLHGLLRTSRLHAADNQAFDQPVAEFRACLEHLTSRLGPVSLVTVEDQVYINDVRVRFGEKTGKPGELGAELRKHNVGGMTFHVTPRDQDIRSLIACFALQPAPGSPRVALSRALAKRGVTQVEFSGIFRYLMAGETRKQQNRDMPGLFERAKRAVDQMWDNTASGRVLNALPLRRMVAEILDVGPGDESLWDEPPKGAPHITHAQRVNHLALLLGKSIGLDDAILQDLGVAALLHDVGYATPPEDARAAHLPHIVAHCVDGARMLACRRGFHEAKVRRVLASLHHHRDFNDRRGRPPLFARIIRIAEDFDNYTRLDGGGLSPPEALGPLVAGAGSRYDAVLVRVFVNTLGRFPPGTLLQLTDDSVVRVISIVRNPSTFGTPRARVVVMFDGVPPDPPRVIDLATEGRPARILRSMDAAPKPRQYH